MMELPNWMLHFQHVCLLRVKPRRHTTVGNYCMSQHNNYIYRYRVRLLARLFSVAYQNGFFFYCSMTQIKDCLMLSFIHLFGLSFFFFNRIVINCLSTHWMKHIKDWGSYLTYWIGVRVFKCMPYLSGTVPLSLNALNWKIWPSKWNSTHTCNIYHMMNLSTSMRGKDRLINVRRIFIYL